MTAIARALKTADRGAADAIAARGRARPQDTASAPAARAAGAAEALRRLGLDRQADPGQGHFYDSYLASEKHHAVVPNVDGLAARVSRLDADEARLFDLIAPMRDPWRFVDDAPLPPAGDTVPHRHRPPHSREPRQRLPGAQAPPLHRSKALATPHPPAPTSPISAPPHQEWGAVGKRRTPRGRSGRTRLLSWRAGPRPTGRPVPPAARSLHAPPASLPGRPRRSAIDTAIGFFSSEDGGSYEVKDRQKDNVGWDLEARRPGKKTLLIEVKGLSGKEVSFELTPNEPKSGSCSWSGFAEALVELGDERICRDPRGSPCG